jgi:hypothetical protein
VVVTDFLYRRLAYHVDGTQAFVFGPKSVYAYNAVTYDMETQTVQSIEDVEQNALAAMNSAQGNVAVVSVPRTGLLFLFPVPMLIRGVLPFFRLTYNTLPVRMAYSQDATELADGTYIDAGVVPQTLSSALPTLDLRASVLGFRVDRKISSNNNNAELRDTRNNILFPGDEDNLANTLPVGAGPTMNPNPALRTKTTVDLGSLRKQVYESGVGGVAPYALRHVTALRFTFDPALNPASGDRNVLSNLFLYGHPEQGSWRNYMQVQDAEHHDAVFAAQMDWGNAPWDSSADRGIRIKNLSPTHEARDIDVYFDNGSIFLQDVRENMFVFSLDRGRSWVERIRLSSLSPGSTSPVILIRRVTTERDPIGSAEILLRTEVGEWVDA